MMGDVVAAAAHHAASLSCDFVRNQLKCVLFTADFPV